MWLAVQMDMYFRPFRTDNELDYLWFYGEVNMGDAADESMKTHISKRSNDDYNVLGHPTFLKFYATSTGNILRRL